MIPYSVHKLVAMVDIRENGMDIDSVLLVRITRACDNENTYRSRHSHYMCIVRTA